MTITAGLFAGLSRPAAARFSFLLSLPSILGAGLKEMYDDRHELFGSGHEVLNLVVGAAVAAVVGYWSIAWLLGYLKRHATYVFVVYRLFLAAAILAMLAAGWMSDAARSEPARRLRRQPDRELGPVAELALHVDRRRRGPGRSSASSPGPGPCRPAWSCGTGGTPSPAAPASMPLPVSITSRHTRVPFAARLEGQLAALGHRLLGVQHQVQEGLLEQFAVEQDGRQAGGRSRG